VIARLPNAVSLATQGVYLPEPSLRFALGRLHTSPKFGLEVWGPHGLDSGVHRPEVVRIAFVGTAQSIADARAWMHSCALGVPGEGDVRSFPGFAEDRGFFCKLLDDPTCDELLTRHELDGVSGERRLRARFERGKEILVSKLRHLAERDQHLDCVILALPDELLEHCWSVDYRDGAREKVHRDFRRELKVEAMRLRLATQILLERTSRQQPSDKGVDPKAQAAWNFFTALYYKAGGIPWVPASLDQRTCYVGVSFFRPRDGGNRMRASVAQAFNETGDGIVLRGQPFEWDERDERSPHLAADAAQRLVDGTVARYTSELKHPPSRVVVFKSSKYWDDERSGFEKGLASIPSYDLVSLTPRDDIRLVRVGKYPVLRGTLLSLGNLSLLYTTGYIPALGAYPHGHLPSPLELSDHHGDRTVPDLAREILALSKLNWNSAMFAGLLPIPLRFAKRIGDVLREVPEDLDPLPNFKYYI